MFSLVFKKNIWTKEHSYTAMWSKKG